MPANHHRRNRTNTDRDKHAASQPASKQQQQTNLHALDSNFRFCKGLEKDRQQKPNDSGRRVQESQLQEEEAGQQGSRAAGQAQCDELVSPSQRAENIVYPHSLPASLRWVVSRPQLRKSASVCGYCKCICMLSRTVANTTVGVSGRPVKSSPPKL